VFAAATPMTRAEFVARQSAEAQKLRLAILDDDTANAALVNLAPANPYLAQSLAVWPQGHFLNFNGLTRLVAALWPFAAIAYLLVAAGASTRGAMP